jgi:hypothetical protein
MKLLARHGARILSLLVLLSGCDRNSQTSAPSKTDSKPTSTQPSPDATTATTRPTTKALLEDKRKALALGSLPLVMDVPESWNMESPAGSSAWLQGPTPHGQVRIQVTSQGTPFNSSTLNLMDEQMKKEAAASEGKTVVKPLRNIGSGAKAREQLDLGDGTIFNANGNPTRARIMDWTIEVYVPQDKSYTMDLLHFAMLPADQYQQDKDFLEKIVSSLRYDAATGLQR